MFTKNNKWFFITLLLISINLNAQKITKGSYLVNPQENAIAVRWESDTQIAFELKFGLNKELSSTVKADLIGTKEAHFLYEARLSSLKTGKKYSYQIISDLVKSRINTFSFNVPRNHPLIFAVTGDSRSRPQVFGAIMDNIKKINPDLILSGGDMVRKGGNYDEWNRYYFDVAKDVIGHIPLIPALGDHEADEIDGDKGILFSYFFYSDKTHDKLWYSFDYGDAHFVALDYRYPDSKEMIEWFKKDMQKTKAKWRFVYMHRPSYNLGGHRSAWGRAVWPKLFSDYKVDIVFAGHSHLYERFYPVRPENDKNAYAVTYITSGGSGASLYKTGQSPLLACTESIFHYMIISLDGNKIDITTKTPQDSLIDHISWTKNGKDFEKLVKSQGELDATAMFMNAISSRLERLPMKEIPAVVNMKLAPVFCDEDIHFEISLTKESNRHYKMETFSAVIRQGKPLSVSLKIFAKEDMQVSKWGDIRPAIHLQATFATDSFKGQILGSDLEYIAY